MDKQGFHSRKQDREFASASENGHSRTNLHPRGNWILDIDYWTLKKTTVE
jgi:hypothetical protein